MNEVVKSLGNKSSLQDFIVALLEEVEKHFRAAAPMAEQKAVGSIHTIFTRVQREFPLVAAVGNIAKRLTKDLKEKIADRVVKGKQKKKTQGLKTFLQGIQTENQELERTGSEESPENIQIWLKKTLLETISELKEDIKQADQHAADALHSKLNRQTSTFPLPEIIFADSFLSNQLAVTGLKGYRIRKVLPEPKGEADISVQQGAKTLRKARFLILSADAILRNGGLLCRSGGLMLAVAARQLGIPVIAFSRSYCLWEHIISNQQPLISHHSGRQWFPQESETSFRTLVGKKYDYVAPQLVTAMVGENRNWESKSVAEMFEEYYN